MLVRTKSWKSSNAGRTLNNQGVLIFRRVRWPQSARPISDGTSCGTRPEKVAGGYQDRCGYGPRQPLLVVSPYAGTNFVDHTLTDQTSVLRFIEDNRQTGRIGNFSFDEKAGSIEKMFRFAPATMPGGENQLFLDLVTGIRADGQGSLQDRSHCFGTERGGRACDLFAFFSNQPMPS